MSENAQEYRERYYAELRRLNAERPDTRKVCSVEGCENRLRSDNVIGRCGEHYYLPVDMPVCVMDGCGNRLTALNSTGRCVEHRQKYWVANVCAAEGCGKILHADNGTGYCHDHRRMAVQHQEYMRAYYQSRKAEFQQYARNWRLANGERHRASARAWAAANHEARQAAQARRRQRAQVAMTDEDRQRSVARRREIKNAPCFYCGSPETSDTDHYFPLAKRGTDHHWNLVRACDDCNSRKNASCGTAFMLRTGRWSQPPLPPPILAA
jgi:5-methylcytosine-specific restriction endonuclease McrA